MNLADAMPQRFLITWTQMPRWLEQDLDDFCDAYGRAILYSMSEISA